jgi:ParG
MSRKTVPFKMPPKPADPMESWVANRAGGAVAEVHDSATVTPLPQPAEAMKRFTIDVTEDLHKRIKAQCALRGIKMADVIREMLEREFPRTSP